MLRMTPFKSCSRWGAVPSQWGSGCALLAALRLWAQPWSEGHRARLTVTLRPPPGSLGRVSLLREDHASTCAGTRCA